MIPTIPCETIHTFNAFLDWCAEHYGPQPAFRWQECDEIHSVTYAELVRDVRALAAVLDDMAPPGAHIAVLGNNSYDWLRCWFAILCACRVAVPLDPMLPQAELLALLQQSDAELLLYAANFGDVASQFQNAHCMDKLPALISAHRHAADWTAAPTGETVASIVFTSGTTGQPKGVMLTHRNLLAPPLHCAERVFEFLGMDALLIMPLHHTLGITGVLGMVGGGCTAICGGLQRLARDMKEFRPHCTVGVPLLFEKLHQTIWQTARQQKKEGQLRALFALARFLPSYRLRRRLFRPVLSAMGGRLTWAFCGGAPIAADIVTAWRRMGIHLFPAYGITECAPTVSIISAQLFRRGSVGPALPCCEVKIADGEILIKGENVFLGYYNDEAATRAAFTPDGWFKTGDLGRLDRKGFLYITGRIKNLIILSNGKNVSPEPLEQKLLETGIVQEVLVYELAGEIAAEVYLAEGRAAEEFQQALAALNRQLPGYQRITKTVLRKTAFPKTTSQKIKRK